MNQLHVFSRQPVKKYSQAMWFVLCFCAHLAILLSWRSEKSLESYGSQHALEVSLLSEQVTSVASTSTLPSK
jgi:hypothetical protein